MLDTNTTRLMIAIVLKKYRIFSVLAEMKIRSRQCVFRQIYFLTYWLIVGHILFSNNTIAIILHLTSILWWKYIAIFTTFYDKIALQADFFFLNVFPPPNRHSRKSTSRHCFIVYCMFYIPRCGNHTLNDENCSFFR